MSCGRRVPAASSGIANQKSPIRSLFSVGRPMTGISLLSGCRPCIEHGRFHWFAMGGCGQRDARAFDVSEHKTHVARACESHSGTAKVGIGPPRWGQKVEWGCVLLSTSGPAKKASRFRRSPTDILSPDLSTRPQDSPRSDFSSHASIASANRLRMLSGKLSHISYESPCWGLDGRLEDYDGNPRDRASSSAQLVSRASRTTRPR